MCAITVLPRLLLSQHLLWAGLLAGAYSLTQTTFAQTTAQTSFGKSRVQYGRQFDEWLHYETAHFDTYWYGEARNIAQAALQIAEWDFASVQQLLEHQISDKIEMLVFTHLSDLKQSNIGDEELLSMKVGETKVLGNRVFVYFDGNHQHLRAQVREGTAGVILNSMIYGNSLQEVVQTAVAVNLPLWYTAGLVAYCGEEWNTDLDNRLRDYFLWKTDMTFDRMARENPRLAGHAFWYYIGLHFGKGTISNLVYLTRINRSVDVGLLYVLGSGYQRITNTLMDYFRARYREEGQSTRKPDSKGEIAFKNKRNLPIYGLKISPDGKKLAWVSNDLGRWKVWISDVGGKNVKAQRIFTGGQRNALQAPDFNYPLLAFSPDNQEMAVLYERRGTLYLTQIDLNTLKRQSQPLAPDYQRIYSMEYLNPKVLVFSGCVRGYGDLFLYNTVNRNTERLTQDFWDDLDATVAVLDGQRGILFSSNRLSDTLAPQRLDTVLPIGTFDIFFFNLDQRSNTLLRLTYTPLYDERYPISLDSQHFAHLSNASGIVNRQVGYLEPYVAYYEDVIHLRDDAQVRALNTQQMGEWPLEQILTFLSPTDTVLKNIDSALIDSIRTFPVIQKRPVVYDQTNYDRNVEEQHSAPRAGRLAQRLRREGKDRLYVRPVQPEVRAHPWLTRYREMGLRAAGLPLPERKLLPDALSTENPENADTSEGPVWRSYADSVRTVAPGWLFQVPDYLRERGPDFLPPSLPDADTLKVTLTEPELQPALPEISRPFSRFRTASATSVPRFMPHRIVPYRLRFRSEFLSTTVDNNLLFEGLESFAGSPQSFTTPPPGILIRANFKDLLEDYVIEMGIRLPTTFNGAEYFLWFDNRKHRLDKRIALYRRTSNHAVGQSPGGGPTGSTQARTTTVLGQYEVRYPLNPFFSLRATGTLRQDKTITLSTNRRTLEQPAFAEQRMALRLSAVYDNTVPIDINLRIGTRAKVFVEAVKRFEFNTEPVWSFRFDRGFMTVIGLDARHYLPLDRRSLLALRMAGATTFGSERILYFLGGVDNWVFPAFNNSIPIPEESAFAFRTLAANLRGFRQNIRNGNSYALLNTELRVPLFKYFTQKPVQSNFWRNFQLVGFFDAGTAWQGGSPYNPDNPVNTIFFYNPPTVTVKVNYFRDPIVAGYGVGVRAPVLGMFLRLDYAWGIETRVVQKPMWHLALGTDF